MCGCDMCMWCASCVCASFTCVMRFTYVWVLHLCVGVSFAGSRIGGTVSIMSTHAGLCYKKSCMCMCVSETVAVFVFVFV